MGNKWQGAAFPVARFLLAAIFVASGFGKIADPSGTQGYMASVGMPATALFLVGAILIEVLGGLALIVGYRARIAALALIVFLVPATILFHAFWAAPPEATQMQMINFMKNLALMGGLLFVAASGAGVFSLDALLARRRAAASSRPHRGAAPVHAHSSLR
jgi:putative oxidoreductase